jgi:hypothetical protein
MASVYHGPHPPRVRAGVQRLAHPDPPVPVIFRRYPDGDVIALMPTLPADHRGHVTCYQHVGQHGAADYETVIRQTRPATPEEYTPLKRELERAPYGYTFTVRARRGRG